MFSGAVPAFTTGKSETLLPLDLQKFPNSFIIFALRWPEIAYLNAKPSLGSEYFIS